MSKQKSIDDQKREYAELFELIKIFGKLNNTSKYFKNDFCIKKYLLDNIKSSAEDVSNECSIMESLIIFINTLLYEINTLQNDLCKERIAKCYITDSIDQLLATIKILDTSFDVEKYLVEQNNHINSVVGIIEEYDEEHYSKKRKIREE